MISGLVILRQQLFFFLLNAQWSRKLETSPVQQTTQRVCPFEVLNLLRIPYQNNNKNQFNQIISDCDHKTITNRILKTSHMSSRSSKERNTSIVTWLIDRLDHRNEPLGVPMKPYGVVFGGLARCSTGQSSVIVVV